MNQIRISPTLAVEGADRAIDFYAAVLGGEVGQRFTHSGKVVFATVHVGGQRIQLKDADEADPPPPAGGGGVVIDVECVDPDAVLARATQLGAAVVFPLADQPYGARQGRFRDPFGHQWIIGSSLTLTDEEVQAALDDL